MRMGKRMKAALEYLGKDYTIENIDGENCIYRDLHNGYDIEISGINHPRGGICNFVCVWDVRKGKDIRAHSVEYVYQPKSLWDLRCILNDLCKKYGPKGTAQ